MAVCSRGSMIRRTGALFLVCLILVYIAIYHVSVFTSRVHALPPHNRTSVFDELQAFIRHPLPANSSSSLVPSMSRVVSQKTTAPKHNGRINILIYAKHRTGSTYTWDFFQRHHEIFSVFEPLNWLYFDQIILQSDRILRNAFKCDFSPIDGSKRPGRANWVRNQVFCHLGRRQNAGCPKLTPKQAGSVCKRKKHTVIKIISQRRLQPLEPLLRDGVKIIHLIRDPRGVISSRKKAKKFTDLGVVTTAADEYCLAQLLDLAYIRALYESDPDLVTSTYKLVRYEDLAMRPTQTMQGMYDFVGMTPDTMVTQYARESSRKANGHLGKNGKPVHENDYGTQRVNPALTSIAWGNKLTIPELRIIEDECAELMALIGYLPIANSRDPNVNMTSYKLTASSVIGNMDIKAIFPNR